MFYQFYILLVAVIYLVLTGHAKATVAVFDPLSQKLGENYKISYKLWEDELSWENSRKVCESHGGYLVTVNSQHVLYRLTMQFGTSLDEELWIGMKVANTANKCKPYIWHSGETEGHWKNWAFNEPDYCSTHTCVRMESRKWKTMDCAAEYKFICEMQHKPTKKDPKETTSLLATYGSEGLDATPYQSTAHQVSSSYFTEPARNGPTETASLLAIDISGGLGVTPYQSTVQQVSSSSSYFTGNEKEPIRNGPMETTSSLATDSRVRLDVTPYQSTVHHVSTSSSYVTETEKISQTETTSVLSTDSGRGLDFAPNQSADYLVRSSRNCCTGKEKEMKCGNIRWDINNTLPDNALEEQIRILKQELRVIRTSTKIYLRSKISVHDNRSSSATIGIAGVVIISAVFVFPVAIDLVNLIAFIKVSFKQRQQSRRVADTDNI